MNKTGFPNKNGRANGGITLHLVACCRHSVFGEASHGHPAVAHLCRSAKPVSNPSAPARRRYNRAFEIGLALRRVDKVSAHTLSRCGMAHPFHRHDTPKSRRGVPNKSVQETLVESRFSWAILFGARVPDLSRSATADARMSHQGYEGWFPECLVCGCGNVGAIVCLYLHAMSTMAWSPSRRQISVSCHRTVTIGNFASCVSGASSQTPGLGVRLRCACSVGQIRDGRGLSADITSVGCRRGRERRGCLKTRGPSQEDQSMSITSPNKTVEGTGPGVFRL